MKATFYDVKLREKVEVEVVGKTTFLVKGQARYALRGETSDGRALTRFVKKEVYDEADVPVIEVKKKED